MTNRRTPLTFADAMTRVAGQIGWAEAERLAGRCNRLVRRWSEPASGKAPGLPLAVAYDVAHRAAGGEGSPFLEAFAHQAEVAEAEQAASRLALVTDCANVARETGEAVAAGLALAQPGAGPLEAHRALVEAQQAETRIRALVRRLGSFLPFGAGPGGGDMGVKA